MPALIDETIKRMRSKIQLRSWLRAIFLYRKANSSPDKAAKPATYLPASTAPIAPEVDFTVALAAVVVAVELAVLLEEEVTEAVVFAALVLEETAEVVTAVVLLAGLVVYWEWELVSVFGLRSMEKANRAVLCHGTSSKDNNEERWDTHIEWYGRYMKVWLKVYSFGFEWRSSFGDGW
jgi:hypothetical protein